MFLIQQLLATSYLLLDHLGLVRLNVTHMDQAKGTFSNDTLTVFGVKRGVSAVLGLQ